MLNFGASKPRVRGGARAPGAPPWIRTWPMVAIFFTGQNEVLTKVIFSQACVILSTGGSGPRGVSSREVLQFFEGSPIFFGGGLQFFRGRGSPIFWGSPIFFGGVSTGIRSTFGWYASYWNAFLLRLIFTELGGHGPLPPRYSPPSPNTWDVGEYGIR